MYINFRSVCLRLALELLYKCGDVLLFFDAEAIWCGQTYDTPARVDWSCIFLPDSSTFKK